MLVIGGGAAGFFAAIRAAERGAQVTVLERNSRFLDKVRISGGGRCNVTHACFDAREFARHYPRGEQALIGPLQRFGAVETVAWFEARGVPLRAETDGRMFPVTNTSQSVVDCLFEAARAAGVALHSGSDVSEVLPLGEGGGFRLRTAASGQWTARRLLLATGGCRGPAMARIAGALGHGLAPCVPSLFTFHVDCAWLRELSGIALSEVEAVIPGLGLRERGPLLITHWGLSGPAILRLSAWAARELHACDYRFELVLDFLPHLGMEELRHAVELRRRTQGARLVATSPVAPLSLRLWERLVEVGGVASGVRWARLSREEQGRLIRQLKQCHLAVTGKSLNKDEFVTCGGVPTREVSFKTMESRICPGLHLAGEILDVDGLTGGFNFQAAWTTGWIAGGAAAAAV